MRILPVSIVACLVALLGAGALDPGWAQRVEPLAVEASPIDLDPENPSRDRVGALTFLAGFWLRSADTRFGGLSGLELSPDGRSLYAVSDRGFLLSARLRHDGNGRLASIDAWTIARLLTPEGRVVNRGEHDAEALARDRDGSLIVAFEQAHRLWRYPPPPAAFVSPPRPIPAPPELSSAPLNGGIEAVTVLPDGRLLALTEEHRNPDGTLRGWLIKNGRFEPVAYLPAAGFQPTDIAALAGGDVLVLERRYTLLGSPVARILRLPGDCLRAGAVLQGIEIASLALPLAVDNFEGLAVHEHPGTGTHVYIVSDDNYNPLQRTLLLQFRMDRNVRGGPCRTP